MKEMDKTTDISARVGKRQEWICYGHCEAHVWYSIVCFEIVFTGFRMPWLNKPCRRYARNSTTTEKTLVKSGSRLKAHHEKINESNRQSGETL